MRAWRSALLVSALILSVCNDPAGPELGEDVVLLEVEYVNFAWAPRYVGFFVDAGGDVYAYDRQGTPWSPADAQVVTEEELTEKFSLGRVLRETRDSAEIATVIARIRQLDDAQLSTPSSRCADAGVLTYRAYQYRRQDRTYHPVLLRAQGDVAQQNLAPAAQALIAYVRSLELLPEMNGCEP